MFQGASHLSKTLLDTYGEDAFAFIIDEGGMFNRYLLGQPRTSDNHFTGGFVEQYGSVIATPGITEKGSLNVKVDVATPGGHSSVPPIHTVSQSYTAPRCLFTSALQSIGILSSLLVKYEANPYDVHLVTTFHGCNRMLLTIV